MYVTTENMHCDPEVTGHISFPASERQSRPTLYFCDIIVEMKDGRKVRLERVEIGKIRFLLRETEKMLEEEEAGL